MALWKTSIVIWSDFDPQKHELSDLAREAEVGDCYCSVSRSVLVENPKADPDWDGTEFFEAGGDGCDREED